jgi:hypothetical protein
VVTWRPIEAFRAKQAEKRKVRLYADMLDNPQIDIEPSTIPDVLKHVRTARLHMLLDRSSNSAGQNEAIRYELARRQGLSALRVAWAAFAVSVLALAVSIIWHD